MSEKDEKSMAMTQKQPEETALDKASNNTGMVIHGEFDFTDEEALSGMPPVIQGYMKSYRYFCRSNNGVFEIRDNQTDEIIEKLEKIDKAIIIYAHHTKTLNRGSMEGLKTDMDKWSDEEKELIALSYDEKSKGSFVHANVEDYLKKPLWDAVTTRVFVFAMFPDLKTGSEVVACSFGITADMIKKPGSLANYRLAIGNIKKTDGSSANLPMQFLIGEMYHTPDENDKGQGYRRVCFQIKTNADGSPCPAYKSAEYYRNHERGMKLHAKIKKSHELAIQYAESGEMPMLSGGSRPAQTNPETISEFNDEPMTQAEKDFLSNDIPM